MRHPFAQGIRSALLPAAAAALAGCGGGSSSGGSGTGSLSVGITDGPVDSADAVVVEFSGVTLKPADGEPIGIDFTDGLGNPSPKQWDLLALDGDASELLLEDETVPAGAYDWIRLHVNAPGADDPATPEREGSYIVVDGGAPQPLDIPSGARTGLKLVSGFTVPAGGELAVTVDFDLRRSVVEAPPGSYKLKPALRIVDDDDTGHLAGTITANYVTNRCPGGDTNGLAVYVFAGGDVTPDDIDGIDPDPVATDTAELDPATNDYDYGIGFLEAGTYTAAVTCNAKDDVVPGNGSGDPVDNDIGLMDAVNVDIEAGTTTTRDFQVP